MNKIEAIIRPEKLDTVSDALIAAGFKEMTITRSAGQGDSKGVTKSAGRGTSTYVDLTFTKIKLGIVVRDEDTSKILDVITESASTGTPGDGRIFVSPIVATVWIDTGERDAASL